jgi:enoyl-CoA hydratase
MTFSTITYESAGGVALITLARPEKRNALSAKMVSELNEAWHRFEAGEDRCAVVAAQGEHFSVGADINDVPPELWRGIPGTATRSTKPIVSATNGWCIGGGFIIVQMSEYCVADETTQFVYPEAKIGLTGGMIASLAARIPQKVASEFIFLGEPMSAQRAYEVGMVNKVVPKGQQIAEAMDVARKLAGMAPLVVSTLKRFIEDMLPSSPVEQMCRTRLSLERISRSEDFAEGVAAFRGRRKPQFSGR